MEAYSFERAIKFYKPWIAARPEVWESLNHKPMGIEIPKGVCMDPWKLCSGPFLTMAHRLHNLVCGPFGTPMARWVGYDCGLVPGIYFGFGLPVEELNPAIRNGLEVPDDYEGLVPFSIGIAIPFPDRRSWELIGLGSINQVAPGAGPAGLTRLTLAFGTSILRDDEIWFVCRWRSHLIGIFAGLGPLEVVTAWTPAHDYPSTVTFKITPDDEARERLLRGAQHDPDEVTTFMDGDDMEAMQALQTDIESGLRVHILNSAEDHGTEVLFPLKVVGHLDQFSGTEGYQEEYGEIDADDQ